MQHAVLVVTQLCEVLDGAVFSAEELARACGVVPDWVRDRVKEGVLQADTEGTSWRFDSAALVRARRIAQLESAFDADPQMAALAADLMEEIARLKRQLKALSARQDS